MGVKHLCGVALCIAWLALLVDTTAALRGMGLPNRELFMDSSTRMLRDTSTNSTASKSAATSDTAGSNTTGLTVDGLKDELSSLKEQLEEKEEEHSKATVAAAATIGSLLLLGLLGCAGALIYRRFVRSQHAGNKKGRADKQPHYDADRLLDDAAGL